MPFYAKGYYILYFYLSRDFIIGNIPDLKEFPMIIESKGQINLRIEFLTVVMQKYKQKREVQLDFS